MQWLVSGCAGVAAAVAFCSTGLGENAIRQTEPISIPLPPEITELIGLPRTRTSNRQFLLDLVTRAAQGAGLPPAIADAVVMVESGYNPSAVGGVGEIGLMQIRPETAEMLGHTTGVPALFAPEINVKFGVMYLSRAWQLAGGDLCRTLMKYRAGWGAEQMSPRSVEYCLRARQHLSEVGSPLAGGAATPVYTAATTAASLVDLEDSRLVKEGLSPPRRPNLSRAANAYRREVMLAQRQTRFPLGQRTNNDSLRFWAAHKARVREITSHLRTSRVKTATGA